MQIGLAAVLPSLYCLATVLVIPWLAQESLKLWQSIQTYDAQHYIAQERIKSSSSLSRTLARGISYAPVLCLLISLSTQMKIWDRTPTILGLLQKAIPYVLLYFLAFQALQRLSLQDSSMERFARLNRYKIWVNASLFKRIIYPTYSGEESLFFSFEGSQERAVLSIILVSVHQIVFKISPITIASFCGLFSYSIFLALPPLRNSTTSFRAMVLVPAALFSIVAAILIAYYTAFVFYFPSSMKNTLGSSYFPVWSSRARSFNLPAAQVLSLYNPLVWSVSSYFSHALVLLAYRYDIVQSQENVVTSGGQQRAPMGSFSVSSEDLPTYQMALSTLIGVQAIGACVDFGTSWRDLFAYPICPGQYNLHSILHLSIWPLLAYPLILVSMILSVSMGKDRTFKSLWTYSESWEIIYKGDESISLVPKKEYLVQDSWMQERKTDTEEKIFESVVFAAGYFKEPNRVTCCTSIDFGRKMIYGADDGVYLEEIGEQPTSPILLFPMQGVTQVALLEEDQILIILAETSIHIFAFDRINQQDPVGNLSLGSRISQQTSFFKVGQCLEKTFICQVKSSPHSTTVKVWEPTGQRRRITNRIKIQDFIRVYKEFYLPMDSNSIHFLKTKLCVGGIKEFQVVDLESLDTQGLLEPTDNNLDIVMLSQDCRPIAIYRVAGEFLLCYSKFAICVDKNGYRTKGNWIVYWNGTPSSFAFHYPYILTFQTNRIEIYHIIPGIIHQIILGDNIRLLTTDDVSGSKSIAASTSKTENHIIYVSRIAQPKLSF